MTQEDFDEMDGIIVHLLLDDREPARAFCSGEIIDPRRWADSKRVRKQCQACLHAARRTMYAKSEAKS